MASALNDFTAGGAHAIDVRSLEKELLRLWKSAAEVAPGESDTPVTRAAVLTLIAVVEGESAANAATITISELTEHAPCRAIVVQRRTDPGVPLEAYASAHCHLVSGGKQVCCEQVTLIVRPEGEPHVSSLIVPLLIPDLPTYLYWPDALCVEPPPLYQALIRDCDFFVVDTARAVDPAGALAHLDQAAHARGPGPRPRDLNWSRLTPWRDLLADFFEPPERRPWLASIHGVTIRAAAGHPGVGKPPDPARPLLFAGWWIRRLGWQTRAVRSEGGRIRFEEEIGRSVDIHLDGAGEPRGRLLGLELHWLDGRRLVVEMGSSGFQLNLLDAGGSPLERSVSRNSEAETRLLCDQIDERSTDPIFVDALHEAALAAKSLAPADFAGSSARKQRR